MTKNVIRIGRFQPGSKRCHCCGYKRESLPLSMRSWVCPVCHTHHDRDINAACNIRDMGLADVALMQHLYKKFPCSHTCQRRCSSERC